METEEDPRSFLATTAQLQEDLDLSTSDHDAAQADAHGYQYMPAAPQTVALYLGHLAADGKSLAPRVTYLNDGGPITERLILDIHRHLVSGVSGGSAAPGQYRRVQNYVVNSATGETIYTPPPVRDVPILMRELVSWLNRPGDIHPVIASGIAQFQLVHIHPFLDGNGRTSRLLSTLCLYRAGYDFKRLFTISEYYDRDRMAFYRALQSVRRTNMDMTGWIEFFAIGLATQLAEVKRRGELAIQQDILARRHDLTDRQVLALRHVLESGRVTINEFEHLCPGIQRRTLQRDLRGLMEKGLLLRRGSTNRLEYVLADGTV